MRAHAQPSAVRFDVVVENRVLAALQAGTFLLLLLFALSASAGGPGMVAGASYFNPETKGTPLTWQSGQISYYTDQGSLSPLLSQSGADAFVADAFSRWTGVTTAALASAKAGQLAEDVNGGNFYTNPDGTITMPADITSSTTGKPVAVVYDADGKVTDALLGSGASTLCFSNAVFSRIDNFDANAHLLHALVILNGVCAQTSNQLTDMKYRLVRALGRVLGLDWSQVNINIFTHDPAWTQEDLNGISIMHAVDPINCVPITLCFPNPDIPKMDDRAAIARLYPVTEDNIGSFSGKQLFGATTARVQGSVLFSTGAQSGQPMQGVNVVARRIDAGQPSRSIVATAVSGAFFRGNAGNPINGYQDPQGNRYDRFGSDDTQLEGFFDLAGLELPNGAAAQYQISVEALDPLWSYPVGPYAPSQVSPSGSFEPVTVTVGQGGDVSQNVVLEDSATAGVDSFEPTTYSEPAALPPAGEWTAKLSGYGNTDYFWFNAQANRTLTVQVTSLDENAAATENKAEPMIGMWALSDPPGTLASAYTPAPFSSLTFGMTQLNATVNAAAALRLGIADWRGDGRPDFAYSARIFYGDTVNPPRASVLGGTPLNVNGVGFESTLSVSAGGATASLLSVTPRLITVASPPRPDGIASIALADTKTSLTSTMTDAITFGAAADDSIHLDHGSNPGTPVGVEAPNPILVSVHSVDGSSPVPGATVVFTSSPAVSFSACGGATTCTRYTDQGGQVSTRVTPLTAGAVTITAALAPASYSPAKNVQTTLLGTASSLDLGLTAPYQFVAEGATLDLTITARVLALGAPLSGRNVSFAIQQGTGSLSSSLTATNSSGYASTSLHITDLQSDVEVVACVEPGDAPCQIYYVTAVANSAWILEPVSGNLQAVTAGSAFQPLTVRVTDNASPPNPVRGVNLVFDSVLCRPQEDSDGHPAMPVILSSTEYSAVSDANGLATIQPSAGRVAGNTEILGSATAGLSSVAYFLQSFDAPEGGLFSGTPSVIGLPPDADFTFFGQSPIR